MKLDDYRTSENVQDQGYTPPPREPTRWDKIKALFNRKDGRV